MDNKKASVRKIKILAIFSFLFSTLALIIIAITPPAGGYEISMYRVFPWYFWFFIISSLICGALILIYQSIIELNSRLWIIGFVAICFNSLIILLLPLFRAIPVWTSGDILSHLGWIEQILESGKIRENNFYPIMHILEAEISYFTGLTIPLISQILCAFLIIFMMVSVFLLGKAVSVKRGEWPLISLFGCLGITGWHLYLHPNLVATLLIPLVLYIFYKSKLTTESTYSYTIILIILLIIMPFVHPLNALLLSLVLLWWGVSVKLYPMLINKKEYHSVVLPSKNFIMAPLLLFIIWFMWFSSFLIFNTLTDTVQSFFSVESEAGSTVIGYVQSQARYSYTAPDFWIELGRTLFLIGKNQYIYHYLPLIGSLYILFMILKGGFHSNEMMRNFLFSSLLIFNFSIWFFFKFSYIGFETSRFYVIGIYFAMVILGIGSYGLIKKSRLTVGRVGKRTIKIINSTLFRGDIKIVLFSLFIIYLIVASTLAIFGSPITRTTSPQVTQMTLSGAKWFVDNKEEGLVSLRLLYDLRRFPTFYGKKGKIIQQYPPPHFKYDSSELFGNAFKVDKYLFLSEADKQYYGYIEEKYRDLVRDFQFYTIYFKKDFERLNEDPSVNKMYSNSELWIYMINSKRLM